MPQGLEESRQAGETVLYTPSAAAGCRLPHVWLRRVSGESEEEEVVSSIDLVDVERYVLLVSEEDNFFLTQRKAGEEEEEEEYEEMQRKRYVLPGQTIIVRASKYEAFDGGEDWNTLWGCDDGALLVRPDGHVEELIFR
jgi:hypothetical protein